MTDIDVSTTADTTAEALVLTCREGAITRITLNRPRAINALNVEMYAKLTAAFTTAASDGSDAILLDGAGERGFCGGGDIKQMAEDGAVRAAEIVRTEYRLDYQIATSPVPVVGIMDGITMGGGIGLAGHAPIRVVTERSTLGMPEVRIGIVPDIGGHLLLARAPGRLGELLAITAGTMTAGDAIALGFADHFVPSERLAELREGLAAGREPGAVVAALSQAAPDAELLAARDWFEPIAEAALGREHVPAAEDPAGAAARLIAGLETSDHPAAQETARTVRGACPVSVAVTLAQIDRTRRLGLDLAQVLADDLRVVGRLAGGPNFIEGVRAQIIDKDRDPRWQPGSIEELDAATLAAVLEPSRPGELTLGL